MFERADQVLDRLRRVRSGIRAEEFRNRSGRKRVADEMSSLFRRKKGKTVSTKRSSTWTHRFVCLSRYDQSTIPTTAVEKDNLISAGLGEKKVIIEDADCNADKFREILLFFDEHSLSSSDRRRVSFCANAVSKFLNSYSRANTAIVGPLNVKITQGLCKAKGGTLT